MQSANLKYRSRVIIVNIFYVFESMAKGINEMLVCGLNNLKQKLN